MFCNTFLFWLKGYSETITSVKSENYDSIRHCLELLIILLIPLNNLSLEKKLAGRIYSI